MRARASAGRRKLSFTREGKYFVAITFGIGFAAINTGNNLLYLLLGMMLALIVGSGVLSELSISGLQADRHAPGRIFAGRPFLMGVTLTNPRTRVPSFSIEVEDLLPGGALDKKCYFLKVPAGRSQHTSYRHTFQRRGLYRFSGVRIGTRFPFTFFRKTRQVDHPGEVVVFPAVSPVTPPRGGGGGPAERGARRRSRQGDVYGLREYLEGDDPRDVYWRKSARVGRLLVRQHENHRGHRIAVFLDNLQPSAEPASLDDLDRREDAVSLAASLCAHYIGKGYSVALSTRSGGVEPGDGQAHLTRILHHLALLEFVDEPKPFSFPVRRRDESITVSLSGCVVGAPSQVAA